MRRLHIIRVAVTVFCAAVILARYTWLQWPQKVKEDPYIHICVLGDNTVLKGAHFVDTLIMIRGTNGVLENCQFDVSPGCPIDGMLCLPFGWKINNCAFGFAPGTYEFRSMPNLREGK